MNHEFICHGYRRRLGSHYDPRSYAGGPSRRFWPVRTGAMQYPAYEFPRTLLLGTWENKLLWPRLGSGSLTTYHLDLSWLLVFQPEHVVSTTLVRPGTRVISRNPGVTSARDDRSGWLAGRVLRTWRSRPLWHGRVEKGWNDRQQQIGVLHNRYVRRAREHGELRMRE